MAYYQNQQEVDNTEGEACIYQIEGSVKGVWYCRIKRHNANGYFRKSLKTTSISTAFKKALRYWLEVRDAEERNKVLMPSSAFKHLAARFLQWRLERGRTDKSVAYMFRNYFVPYFGNESVAHINDNRYIAFLNDYRLKNPARKKPKLRTLEVEQVHLNTFLKWCYENNHIRRPVRLSKLRLNANEWIKDETLLDRGSKERRDLATYEVYTYFRDYFDYGSKWSHPRIKEEPFHVLVNRKRASFYLKTLYNLCCRTGEELLKAKWKDITKHESKEKKGAFYVSLEVRHGKKVNRNRFDGIDFLTYVSDYRYIEMLSRWKTFLGEIGFPNGEDDYLFPLKKGRADRLGRRLRESRGLPAEEFTHWDSRAAGAFIKRTRLKVLEWRREKGEVDQTLEEEIMGFTWYSVRHVSIKRMLMTSNFPLHFVAEKAQTGISMIEDFYWKYMQNPEGRIISRSATISPDKREIQVFSPDALAALSDLKTE